MAVNVTPGFDLQPSSQQVPFLQIILQTLIS